MGNVVEFPSATRSQEDAALWLARLDKGLTTDERSALGAWLAESAANRDALVELAALWDELDVLSELSDLFPLERRAAAPRGRRRAVWLIAAASAVVLAAAALVVREQRTAPVESSGAAAAAERFETDVGGQAKQELADGSVLTLNTDTEVDVALASEARDVYLRRGEASFEVAHDTARPFRVHAGSRVLEAVGTAFNVYLKPDGGLELTVTEGSVKIDAEPAEPAPARTQAAAESRTTVAAGELAIVERGDGARAATPRIMKLDPADLDVKLAWQRGMLIFRGEPLPRILEEVGRYTTTEFVLGDDALRTVRVGGYFRAGDVDGLLLTLRESFQIDFERVGPARVVLKRPGPDR